MLMPTPENERRALSIEDFINSTQDKQKRKKYKELLSPLEPLSNRIKATWPAPDGMPDIRIVTNAAADDTELRDMANTVCLAQGLLDSCLESGDQATEIIGFAQTPRPLGKLSIAKVAIMWSCAHEIFHYLRRHMLVEKHFGNDPATKHALEYDADLCAIAAIYRFMQYFSPNKSALHLKKMVLKLIFWPMRILVEGSKDKSFGGSQSHPHFVARLLDITDKLAVMHDSGTPDPNFQMPLSHLHHQELMDVLINLELEYNRSVETKSLEQESTIFSFVMENLDLTYTLKRHKRWDEIQPLINSFARFSRNTIENDMSIAFIGDNFSLPRNPIK